jgi:hypothetical protein
MEWEMKNKSIWLGGLIGFLVYYLYSLLITGLYYPFFSNIPQGYYGHEILGGFLVSFTLISLPQAIFVGGIGGLLITALFLKRIKKPVYVGLTIAILYYLISGSYFDITKFGFLANLIFGREYSGFGTQMFIKFVINLLVILGAGALIGHIIEKLKNEHKNKHSSKLGKLSVK